MADETNIKPDEFSRAELEQLAADAGIDQVSSYPNKAALVEAINAARSADGAGEAGDDEAEPEANQQPDETVGTYRVSLPATFPAARRNRAGISVAAGETYEGPLTGVQLAALQADDQFTVETA